MSILDNLNQLMEKTGNIKSIKPEKENVEEDLQNEDDTISGNYFVTDVYADYSEDDYEKGVIGEPMSKEVSLRGTEFDDIKQLADQLGFDDNNDAWIAFKDGRIIHNRQENENGDEPSKKEIADWKDGKVKLYNVDYNFHIAKKDVPSVDEISKTLGIQKY